MKALTYLEYHKILLAKAKEEKWSLDQYIMLAELAQEFYSLQFNQFMLTKYFTGWVETENGCAYSNGEDFWFGKSELNTEYPNIDTFINTVNEEEFLVFSDIAVINLGIEKLKDKIFP